MTTRLQATDANRHGRRGAPGRWIIGWSLAALSLLTLGPAGALAGGGPENVMLVVNPRSTASLTVANHFIQMRDLPVVNVVYLDWSGWVVEPVKVETFRREILEPVLAAIRQRGLTDQIDYVVYSSDFPSSVDLRDDIGDRKLPQFLTPYGSINAMTYFHEYTLAKNLTYLELQANHYARRPSAVSGSNETHGFRSWYGWGDNGELIEAGGKRYLLSTMLAVTSGRGNSVSEVINYLSRSVESDGTHPQGTIYFAKNDDIRSTAREPGFAAAVAALAKLGVKGEIFNGRLPEGKKDIQGLTTGTAGFNWRPANSEILPGAICENLTSFGGNLNDTAAQPPLTEFLRYGAAGSCGTVTEPYLVPLKFPTPEVQVHYARGSSLAEAFYQSVFGPYQLLIVGDPLCQPWANIPTISVEGLDAEQPVEGKIRLTPTATMTGTADVDRFELYVDGLRRGDCKPGESLEFDTAQLVDGYHEIRVVGIEASAIESQGRWVSPLRTRHYGKQIEFSASLNGKKLGNQPPRVEGNEVLKLSAQSPGAKQIHFFQFSRLLGTINGEQGELDVLAQALGEGPVELRAIAIGDGGAQGAVVAEPLLLDIVRPRRLPPVANIDWRSLPEGLKLETQRGQTTVVTDTKRPDWLFAAGVGSGETFRLSACVYAKTNQVHYFQVQHNGPLRIDVDGNTVFNAGAADLNKLAYVPVSLQAGVHRVEISGTAGTPVRLGIRFGGEGTRRLDRAQFRVES